MTLTTILIFYNKNHWKYYCDYVTRLIKYLENYQIKSVLLDDPLLLSQQCDTTTTTTIDCCIFLGRKPTIVNWNSTAIFLNLEQLSDSSHLKYIENMKFTIVIDYSQANIQILNTKLPHVKTIYFPFIIQNNLNRKSISEKSIQAVSLVNCPRRNMKIRTGKVACLPFNNLWGEERDKLIANSKILINLHYCDSRCTILESIRCYHALELGTLVISEHCTDSSLEIFGDKIIYTNCFDKPFDYRYYYDQIFKPGWLEEMLEKQKCVYDQSVRSLLNLLSRS